MTARRRESMAFTGNGREAHLNAEPNTLVAKNAEQYHRTMGRGNEALQAQRRYKEEVLETDPTGV